MTPERWQLAKELFGSALEKPGGERATYLAEACRGDQSLRREVESLLESDEHSLGFMNVAAVGEAMRVMADTRDEALLGRRLGRYEVISPLGRGGMSVVYLARDVRLERKVALKLLGPEVVQGPEQMRRFEQEAYAASSLNHPNIVMIYEVDEHQGRPFIAAEYVDGITLREHLAARAGGLLEALDVAIQVADALAAAHQAGIIHRDVKPENVMLRKDGFVKVLDFGLAKLMKGVLHQERAGAASAAAKRAVETEPGMVMGTVAYMSPEQARGVQVDARTDIWSLGVMLYEMIAGHLPFGGVTKSDVLAALLREDPAPLRLEECEAAAQLQRIIKKALAKNVDERYQDVRDFRLDLKGLRRELESNTGAARHASAPERGENLPSNEGRERRGGGSATRASRVVTFAALLIVAAALVGAAYALYRLAGKRPASPASVEAAGAVRLTNHGKAKHAAISPDGKYIAYVSEEAGRQSVAIKQLATESVGVLVPPSDALYRGLTFSRDGSQIFYVAAVDGEASGALFRVSAPIPNSVQKLLGGVDSQISLSPDNEQLTFVRENSARGESALMIARADGSDERVLAVRRRPEYFALEGPAWSPDGRIIACSAISYEPRYHEDLVGVSVKDGSEERITSDTWANIGGASWLSDHSGLLIIARAVYADAQPGRAASEDPQYQDQLWHISYPGGRASRVTGELNKYSGASLSADSTRLVSLQAVNDTNLWALPGRKDEWRSLSQGSGLATQGARQLTRGLFKYDGADGLAHMPDGRIVFVSYESGNRDIWLLDPDGGALKNLTAGLNSSERSPVVSPDGRYIVFSSTRAGERNIWRMDIDGTNLRQMTNGQLESDPAISPDGRWLIYTSIGGDAKKAVLWKLSTTGGTPRQLTTNLAARPAVSPDGKAIAYFERAESNSPLRLVVISADGGAPIKAFEVSSQVDQSKPPVARWSPDGRMLTYVGRHEDTSIVWGLPLAGGKPVQVAALKDDKILWFDWSPNGKQLVISRERETSDVVLLNLKK